MSQNFPHTLEVWTEGKTDWIHLKTAMRKLGLNLPIVFRENKEPMGDGTLLNMCQTFAEREKASPVVFIFDHDKSDIIQKVNDPINSYKSWRNEVYSFSIPVPSHRKGYSNICIEMLYTDSEIYTKDSSSRRLYLTSEFHPVSLVASDPARFVDLATGIARDPARRRALSSRIEMAAPRLFGDESPVRAFAGHLERLAAR